MKKPSFLIFCLSISWVINAQQHTYIGIESGVTNDQFEFFDDGDLMVSIPLNSFRGGVIVGHSFGDLFSLETGFFLKNYTEGFGFEMPMFRGTSTSSSIRTWQIPFRIKPRVKLFSDNLFFTPTIGFHYCINRDHLLRNERNSLGHSNFINYQYDADYTRSRTFLLLETGLGLEMNLFRSVRLNFTMSYFTGFQKVVEIDMTYTAFDGPDIMARGHSKGEYVSASLGVHIPIIGHFR